MTSRRLLLASAFALLAAAGCSTPSTPVAKKAARVSAGLGASPAPSGPDAKQQLLAALRRSQQASHKFAVRADLPDKQKVKATGAFDPKKRRFSVTMKESGGKNPQAAQRIVVGTDSFSRERAGERWVHLDLKRIKPDDPLLFFDMKDPTGLARFATSIASVEPAGPGRYRGEFNPHQPGDPFAPIGTPSVYSLGWGTADFTAATDGKGWVTSISLQMPDGKAKLTMTTTLSGHGKPTGITRPKSYGEAADFYYK
jgi:hypothetical protein